MKSINKVAIITGGARGIGLAIVMRFLKENYSIALLDRDETSLNALQDWVKDHDILVQKCDVSVPDQVITCVDKIMTHFGRIDSLINNAGIAIFKPAIQITYEDWIHIMATNLNGPFICTQACIPHMM
jgi:NAD(P)-dependent dehydrogenase (short-subunit alcohol dehydrogenase family)